MGRKKNTRYDLCYRDLCQDFAKRDPEEMARKSGAKYNPETKEFALTYLNKTYLISYPEGNILLQTGEEKRLNQTEEAMLLERVVFISYLLHSTSSPRTGKWVTYRELPGVKDPFDHYTAAGVEKLVKLFGNNGELFLKVCAELGAKPLTQGDIGLEIMAFPNIPVALVLWLEDEELSASANILYDYSAINEAHGDDLAALAPWLVVEELERIAKQLLK